MVKIQKQENCKCQKTLRQMCSDAKKEVKKQTNKIQKKKKKKKPKERP